MALTIAPQQMARISRATAAIGRSAVQGGQIAGIALGGAVTSLAQSGMGMMTAAVEQGRAQLRTPVTSIEPASPPPEAQE